MKRLTLKQIPSVRTILAKQQRGQCALCKQPFTRWDRAVLDHSHINGCIRGALHSSCNQTEGKIRYAARRCHKGVSSQDYIIGLGKYLEEHRLPKHKLLHPTHRKKK